MLGALKTKAGRMTNAPDDPSFVIAEKRFGVVFQTEQVVLRAESHYSVHVGKPGDPTELSEYEKWCEQHEALSEGDLGAIADHIAAFKRRPEAAATETHVIQQTHRLVRGAVSATPAPAAAGPLP